MERAECRACFRERKRRARVLQKTTHPDQAEILLKSDRFADAILITPWNDAVFAFANMSARIFAYGTRQQLYWAQASDWPPNHFASDYTQSQLEAMKKNWLHYNSRKTGDILSLLPLCLNMPLRVTHRGQDGWKEYGIFKGALCKFKGFELGDADKTWVHESSNNEIILREMPKKLYVEMDREMPKQYDGLPHNWFPLTAVSVKWSLGYGDDQAIIQRQGFPVVPNFSSTVHSATGRTLNSAIVDIGAVKEMPSFNTAMKGYIALSRVDCIRSPHRPTIQPSTLSVGTTPISNFAAPGPARHVAQRWFVLGGEMRSCSSIAGQQRATKIDKMDMAMRNLWGSQNTRQICPLETRRHVLRHFRTCHCPWSYAHVSSLLRATEMPQMRQEIKSGFLFRI